MTTSTDSLCSDLYTNIGDSEYFGGTRVFCSSIARTADEQGLLPTNFWKNVEFHAGQGDNGGKYVQCEYNPLF
jgi:hypothetical protein